jgi:hypothetical protein
MVDTARGEVDTCCVESVVCSVRLDDTVCGEIQIPLARRNS